MIKSKVIEELTQQSIPMLDLIVDSEELNPEFSVLRELFEQFADELKTLNDE